MRPKNLTPIQVNYVTSKDEHLNIRLKSSNLRDDEIIIEQQNDMWLEHKDIFSIASCVLETLGFVVTGIMRVDRKLLLCIEKSPQSLKEASAAYKMPSLLARGSHHSARILKGSFRVGTHVKALDYRSKPE